MENLLIREKMQQLLGSGRTHGGSSLEIIVIDSLIKNGGKSYNQSRKPKEGKIYQHQENSRPLNEV